MINYKQLRQFKPEELFLNEEETRIVLKFIFKPSDHDLIDSLPINDHLRGFAQGLPRFPEQPTHLDLDRRARLAVG